MKRNKFPIKIIPLASYLIPILFGLLIIANKVFPAETYFYDPKKIDDSTIFLLKDNSFSLSPDYEFKKIKLTLGTPLEKSNQKIVITKGFAASYYPLGENPIIPSYQIKHCCNRYYLLEAKEKKLIPTLEILESYQEQEKIAREEKALLEKLPLAEELVTYQDGTLISFKGTVSVVSKGKKIPFSSPWVFEALGYDWSKVREINAGENKIHATSPAPLLLSSSHPDGTIFKEKDSSNYYLINKGERIKLSATDWETYYSKINPIEINPTKIERICVLDSQGDCLIKPDQELKSQMGNAYHFQLPKEMKIEKIKVTFERKFSLDNLRLIMRKMNF